MYSVIKHSSLSCQYKNEIIMTTNDLISAQNLVHQLLTNDINIIKDNQYNTNFDCHYERTDVQIADIVDSNKHTKYSSTTCCGILLSEFCLVYSVGEDDKKFNTQDRSNTVYCIVLCS